MVPSELEGTDYLLSSTMRLEDSFLQILGKLDLVGLQCFVIGYDRDGDISSKTSYI